MPALQGFPNFDMFAAHHGGGAVADAGSLFEGGKKYVFLTREVKQRGGFKSPELSHRGLPVIVGNGVFGFREQLVAMMMVSRQVVADVVHDVLSYDVDRA